MKFPRLIKSLSEMSEISKRMIRPTGLIPTMGFLHAGHLSLVKAAGKNCKTKIVSIYVNPTQFGTGEDLGKYPRDLEQDLRKLAELDVDFVFSPSDLEMYPPGFKTWISVNEITTILCGRSRPTHFRGVTTVVSKLINIIDPDLVYMGEKDFQQLIVLRQMVKDLNFRARIIGCPLVREPDGLAMSSRNKYLTDSNRKKALCLYRALQKAKIMFIDGITDFKQVKTEMIKIVDKANGRIDYIEAVDPVSLKSVTILATAVRILIAVYIDNTRLIDNIAL